MGGANNNRRRKSSTCHSNGQSTASGAHPRSISRRNSNSNNILLPALTAMVSTGSTSSTENEFCFQEVRLKEDNEQSVDIDTTDDNNVNSTNNSKAFSLWLVRLRELWIVAALLVLLAAVSIAVGFAAGITISIQYHEPGHTNSDNHILINDASTDSFLHASLGKVTLPAILSLDTLELSQQRDRRTLLLLGADDDTDTDYGSSSPFTENQWTVLDESRTVASGVTTTTTTIDDFLPSNSGLYEHWSHQHDQHHTHSENFQAEPSISRVPSMMDFEQHYIRLPPKLCSDGATVGYDSWRHLHSAIRDANRYSAERYRLWQEYFAAAADAAAKAQDSSTTLPPSQSASASSSLFVFADDTMYYDEEMIFTICPDTVLKPTTGLWGDGGGGPMLLNTENMVIECANRNCIFDVDGPHLSFGPDAKNVQVRGITFVAHITCSSLLFYHNGADASFEDCTWIVDRRNNISHYGGSGRDLEGTYYWGAIADVNSTSTVNFYRCFMNPPISNRESSVPSLSIRQSFNN
jgi:hypothetical protein